MLILIYSHGDLLKLLFQDFIRFLTNLIWNCLLVTVYLLVISDSLTSNETFERLCGVPLKGPFFGFLNSLIRKYFSAVSFKHYVLAYSFHRLLLNYPCLLRVSQHISQEFLVTVVTLLITILPLQFSVIVVKTTPL